MAYEVRVALKDENTAVGDVALFIDGAKQLRGGMISNSARAWSHVPHIALLYLLSGLVQREGTGGSLSTRIKEMAVLKTSHINTCAY